ncbi:hypothetical protein [Streptomyces sp. NPDC058326]|uniref:hypothetical protein n=1 Tax=Streptomyces sp. NPDC058326 TaxID=3346447 RepID=UPI0036E1C338
MGDAEDRLAHDAALQERLGRRARLRAEGSVDDVRPGKHLSYRLSPLLPDGRVAFTAHEIGFGQSLDKLAANIAADTRSADAHDTDGAASQPHRQDPQP